MIICTYSARELWKALNILCSSAASLVVGHSLPRMRSSSGVKGMVLVSIIMYI